MDFVNKKAAFFFKNAAFLRLPVFGQKKTAAAWNTCDRYV